MKKKYWSITGEKIDKKGYVKIPVEAYNIFMIFFYLTFILNLINLINTIINL